MRDKILEANKRIVEEGLVELTWGNVSFFDRDRQLIFIKPSGVDLLKTSPCDISVVSPSGEHLDGKRPSVDLPTHLEIYRGFDEVNSIVHTHSKYSTVFAQANTSIPCLGTTHADYFYGEIPCVYHVTEKQADQDYERFTGLEIIRYYEQNLIKCCDVPSCLISGHGVFSWSNTVEKALEIAKVTELVAEMAYKTLLLNPNANIKKFIVSKHFLRKNGDNRTYGQ